MVRRWSFSHSEWGKWQGWWSCAYQWGTTVTSWRPQYHFFFSWTAPHREREHCYSRKAECCENIPTAQRRLKSLPGFRHIWAVRTAAARLITRGGWVERRGPHFWAAAKVSCWTRAILLRTFRVMPIGEACSSLRWSHSAVAEGPAWDNHTSNPPSAPGIRLKHHQSHLSALYKTSIKAK